MKLIKNASGKQVVKISKLDWVKMGLKSGWLKKAQSNPLDSMDDVRDEVGSTNAPHGMGYPNAHNYKDRELSNVIRDLLANPTKEEAAGWEVVFPCYITAYDLSRQLGGQEEGGWYYDAYEVIESVPVNSVEQIKPIVDRMLANYKGSTDGRLIIELEAVSGDMVSDRPHYE